MTSRQKSKLVEVLFRQMFETEIGKTLAIVKFQSGGGVIKFTPSPLAFSKREYTGKVCGRKLTLMACTASGFHKSALLRKWGFNCAWLWENYDNPAIRCRLSLIVQAKNGLLGIYHYKGGDPEIRAFENMRDEISEAREQTFRLS